MRSPPVTHQRRIRRWSRWKRSGTSVPRVLRSYKALVALWERSVRATHGFLTEADINDLRPQVLEALSDDALELWVLADRADVPVGFMGLVDHDIAALFLEPAARGQGGAGSSSHTPNSCARASLTVDVNEQNPAALGFYEALGFVVVGRSPVDGDGRPFPLLHMRRPAPARPAARALPSNRAWLPRSRSNARWSGDRLGGALSARGATRGSTSTRPLLRIAKEAACGEGMLCVRYGELEGVHGCSERLQDLAQFGLGPVAP